LDPRADGPVDRRLGVLAFGDSITNGGGELQWGVALQSWALWVARALGLPYTGNAVDGARVTDVVSVQIPRFTALNATPEARYELGCLYIGVNDVRSVAWDPAEFETEHRIAARFIAERCDRLLLVTAPRRLGRPPTCTSKVAELNRTVARTAAEHDALLLDLGAFGARNLVMPDQVHPTAFGQLSIAERALEVLERDGLPARVAPSALIGYETTRIGRLRGDWTYAYRSAKLVLRSARMRVPVGMAPGREAGPPPR